MIEVYQAKDGWRWRFISRNGRIVADSGEAYTRRDNAIRAAKMARRRISVAKVVAE